MNELQQVSWLLTASEIFLSREEFLWLCFLIYASKRISQPTSNQRSVSMSGKNENWKGSKIIELSKPFTRFIAALYPTMETILAANCDTCFDYRFHPLPSFSFTTPSNRNFMMHVMELHYKTFSWQTISNKSFNAKLDTVHLAKGNIWSLFLSLFYLSLSLYLPIYYMAQFGVAFCKQNAKQSVIICTISIGEQFCL